MRTRPWDSRALLALGLLIFLEPGSAPADDIRPAVGHRAPDFALHDLNARTVRLSEISRKKAILLNFWATWCVPCREEMPTMERAYRAYRSRGLEILAISLDFPRRSSSIGAA